MTNCPICGELLKTIPAGISKKPGPNFGKPYPAFTACPNKCNTSWNNPSPQVPQGGKVNVSAIDPMKILFEEVQALRGDVLTKQHFDDRMNKMAEYLKSKFN